ncbi:MAG: chitin deacetylase family protein [Thermodesulfobacteriota bacterium]
MRKRRKIVTILLAILLFVLWSIVFQPYGILRAIARLSPDVLYFVETGQPTLALTIDDGPDSVTTPKILDLLKLHQTYATFFIITDRLRGNEEIVRRMVNEGHELANHLTTDEASILLKNAEFEQRLLAAHDALSRFSKVRWFRPGSGWYNRRMLSVLHKHGYRCVLGSVYPFDPQIPSSWFATRHVLRKARPGSVLVLHDHGSRGERTIEVLTKVLPELKRRGLRVATLSELVDRT